MRVRLSLTACLFASVISLLAACSPQVAGADTVGNAKQFLTELDAVANGADFASVMQRYTCPEFPQNNDAKGVVYIDLLMQDFGYYDGKPLIEALACQAATDQANAVRCSYSITKLVPQPGGEMQPTIVQKEVTLTYKDGKICDADVP